MRRQAKRILAFVFAVAILISCTGCSITVSDENYRRYMQDPDAYIRSELGEDHALLGFFSSSLGKRILTALMEEAKAQAEEEAKQKEEEAQKPQPEAPATPQLLYYSAPTWEQKFLMDYDWDYMTEKNDFYRITGYISHAIAGAKGKYKDAFRAYMNEFIFNNESRYEMMEIPFEEEKEIFLGIFQGIEDGLEAFKAVADPASESVKLANQMLNDNKHFIDILKDASEFPKNFDENFAELLEKVLPFVKTHNIELKAKVPAIKQLDGLLGKVGKVTGAISLAFDVADCIQSAKDVREIQQKAFLFFELEEIFTEIITNSTNYYMQEAARDILREIRDGYVTDIDDMIERKGVQAIIDITPVLGPVSSLFDLAIGSLPVFAELNSAYAADAARHINMACCELLKDYTVRTEGDLQYYEPQHETEVQIYLLHCLQSRLVSTYLRNDGKTVDSSVVSYADRSGITLPENAIKYTKKK